ncbi:MAG: DUF1553 domain-containing protein, partial [Bacteroidota bacterium]
LTCTFSVLLICLFQACGPNIPEEVEFANASLPEQIDFNFHVRPILSDRCFSCHGPDANSRQAELRLDLERDAFASLASGKGKAFVAGSVGRSVAIHRILTENHEILMPPPESHLTLTDREKAILIKWVQQGAKWKEHWAFSKPETPKIPKSTAQTPLAKNPIDQFVFAKLEGENLSPSPLANKEQLLRRVSLDLTGLPPTVEEVEAFVADTSAKAYEKVVDRLLASEAAAERLAMDWMDVARYADSHGLHADGWRMMWPWRDWVINAFHQNMPYDQFVTEQLAGDLLPDATHSQKLATAFNRNHPMTAEGGVIDEEFRLNYVFDRAETVGTAFLGLTLNCARCHDHKFDPLSQKEYYQISSFFNNIKELGMTGNDGNYGPMLSVADQETKERINFLKTKIAEKEKDLELTQQEIISTKDFLKGLPSQNIIHGKQYHYPLESIRERKSTEKAGTWYFRNSIDNNYIVDNTLLAFSHRPSTSVEGKVGNALLFEGNFDWLHLRRTGLLEVYDSYSAGMWINTTKKKVGLTQSLLSTAGTKDEFWRGWDFYLDSHNRLNVRLIHCLPHNYLHVRTLDSIEVNQWQHVAFTYDGSGHGAGFRLYIDGEESETQVEFDQLYKSIFPTNAPDKESDKRPIRVSTSYRAFTGEYGVFKGRIDEIRLFERALSPIEIGMIAGSLDPKKIDEHPQKQELLSEYWLRRNSKLKEEKKALYDLRKEWLEAMNTIPEVMVMEELPAPRKAYAYSRGEYDAPMYEVFPATPETVLSFPDTLPPNRLGLAQWLFDENNPLTARVTVNRYWQMLFGTGLVKTTQDFGVQGELPSHPALLDWLAIHFMESGWDVKQLLKTMVASHTYQQDSRTSQELLNKDPENRLLARGPSYRLPAEMIRDNALVASGLIAHEVGGESVRPYQPEGLWIEKSTFSAKLLRYKESEGDNLHRRSLYTFVKRTSPHPAMTAFDAPNRDFCVVKREKTNTPLQALVLMNDPQFVEAARVMAQKVQQKAPGDLQAQLAYAWKASIGRTSSEKELGFLVEFFQHQLITFQDSPQKAKELLATGKHPQDPSLDPAYTAALTMVNSIILNHDEAYMKR